MDEELKTEEIKTFSQLMDLCRVEGKDYNEVCRRYVLARRDRIPFYWVPKWGSFSTFEED